MGGHGREDGNYNDQKKDFPGRRGDERDLLSESRKYRVEIIRKRFFGRVYGELRNEKSVICRIGRNKISGDKNSGLSMYSGYSTS